MIFNFLLVGFGGAIGSMLRHGVGLVLLRLVGTGFPWGTFIANIIGSFCIGVVVGVLALLTQWSQEVRLFAVVGVLGGFTTFSAFSLDTILLFERGQYLNAAFYVLGSVVVAVMATFAGMVLIRTISG